MMENKTIESNNIMGFSPILKTQDVRVLRPFEVKKLLGVIPKDDQRYKFQALLFSGMRYIEAKLLFDNKQWFNGELIHLTKEAIKKPKIRIKERHIRLNYLGREAVRNYLNCNKGLPRYEVWNENLKRWAKKADMPVDYLVPKSTRKTWESWLLTSYPDKSIYILSSQGHNLITSLDHYLNIGFYDKDIKEMQEFVIGWI